MSNPPPAETTEMNGDHFDILRFNIPSAKICAKTSPEADLRPGSMFLSVRKLTSVHPETPEGANWSFQFINEQFAARSRKPRDCAEAYFTYAAQEIPKIDVEIVAKGHLWMETNQIPS